MMKVAVYANDAQWEEIITLSSLVNWIRLNSPKDDLLNADAFFILDKITEFDFTITDKPVFIHAVNPTLLSLHTTGNVLRINAWSGFLKNPVWEITGNITADSIEVMKRLGKDYVAVKDEPGMITPRILAMIINEAYFALGEEVSTKDEIDTAMKLGTSYPYGPFEWAEKIGLSNIYDLLKLLNTTDKRYLPAPLMEKEAAKWH